MDDLAALARRIFEAQPFSRFLGATLGDCGAEQAQIHLPIVEHLTQQHGFVHGGVLSYLADNAITFAGGLALGGDALTAEFKINYLKPAVGVRLIARAHAKAKGKRQAVCLCDIVSVAADGAETLCAIAQGTVVSASR